MEAKKRKSSLYIALMDARKAFDILWHLGLLREMHKTGLEGNNWLFFENWYTELTSKVKWKGELSHQIIEQQGVRQGGIWSPSAYKIFVNSLLTTFEENQIGATIGSIYCGIPTVADDVTLITTDPYELQTMLDIQSSFANKNRYEISEQKSVVLTFNDSSECNWHLNGKLMATPTSSTHLGIERDNTSNTGTKLVVKKRIITARRTVYALMGAGLHGLNGVNPKAAIHLIQTYVLPRLLYGLDVITLTTEDIENLSTYFRELLRQIQHLNERKLLLSDSSSRTKSLQYNLGRFTKTVEIANIYDLPSPYDIIDNPPGKQLWKNLVNKTVGDHCIKQMISEAKSKSTLSRLNYENVKEGKIHNIWKSCGTNPYAITSASLKAKLATGTIYLQYHRAKFSNGHVSPICQLCAEEEEDILHFILKCSKLQYIRNDFLHMIGEVLTENLEDQDLIQELITNDEHLCQLVIDCSKFRFLMRMHRIE
ncbi:Hypothetical predicted protein [Mytilus galloprovincialis]|uniref:Reverse transcriptase domain-containing protein n=1 Tax=Mytilus galloprovincialis TaxID=29158 RepID=A0A8B6D096_MYTGA|nr:Hypothetical predicted protein [Mytilus galloprovincialis]